MLHLDDAAPALTAEAVPAVPQDAPLESFARFAAQPDTAPPGVALPSMEATLPRPEALVPIASQPAPLTASATAMPAASAAPARPAAEATPQLVLRVAQAVEQGVESVSVDLRPPELGRVELRLTFREGTVQVVMLAERAETFEALRQERHSLMQQMEQAGLQLGGNGLDLQHGQLARQDGDTPRGQRFALAEATPEEEPAAEATPHPPASDSLIDIIA